MSKSIIPRNYDEWVHCITVECRLELSPEFIEQRIAALQDNKDYNTQQFVKLYGDDYRQVVLGWFHRARGGA